MKKAAITIIGAVALASLLGTQQTDEPTRLPTDHPTIRPPVPQVHPPVQRERAETMAADPDDVKSIDSIVTAYYDVISGPAGEPRDWNRFRSLFIPDARFVTTRAAGGGASPVMMTPEQFILFNQNYFERGGYFENEIHRRHDGFANIAQVFSTYEARHKQEEPHPYSRGINSIQLLSTGDRWWIVTVMWDYERTNKSAIPPEYLPTGTTPDD